MTESERTDYGRTYPSPSETTWPQGKHHKADRKDSRGPHGGARDSVPELRKLLVSTIVEQLKSKLAQINELDEAIAKTIQEEEELETEICDADTYQSKLEQQIAFLIKFIKKASDSPRVQLPTPHPQ